MEGDGGAFGRLLSRSETISEMADKILSWCGNALLATVLVMLTLSNSVWAQEGEAEAAAEGTSSDSGQITVPLSGTASIMNVDSLSVSSNPLEFGVLEIGNSKTLNMTLSHTGAAGAPAIAISDAVLFGKSQDEFTTNFNGFATLYGGESIDVEIIYTPLSPGDKSAGLRLGVEGSTAPYVLLFNGSARYPLTSDLASSDALINFGEAIEGTTSARNFLLTNQGDADAPPITISAIQLSGDTPQDFNVTFTPTTLNPGQTLDVQVSMSSANSGFKTADLVVIHNGNNPSIEVRFEGDVVKPDDVPVNFTKSLVDANQDITRGTALQFGPDGKLYVTEMDGAIHIFNVTRNGQNDYSATKEETIELVKNVQNHNDDGSLDFSSKRLVTGILVVGTAADPEIYVASSDPRQAAGSSGTDSGLDTNSGILHKLIKNGDDWTKFDLVRGLPRSEENHVPNGLIMLGDKILLNSGGHTNMGAPSNNFAHLPEYALSAAVLEIDIDAIGNSTYDLPTLDDEDRPGTVDENDPFGGNDGKNQAKLVQGGPVQIYASGMRNIYDILQMESGNIYVWDNGPNSGWGGEPLNNCSQNTSEGGDTNPDGLHLITKGYYGGHPNPTRGNKNNTFNDSNPQTPIEVAENPEECDYFIPGPADGSLTTIPASSNGLAEYTASNFGGAMKGDLLVATFQNSIVRIQLNASGTAVTSKSTLIKFAGKVPLDVVAQGDDEEFPGTIWYVDNINAEISVLEPDDF